MMDKNLAKEIIKPQHAGLIVGTGLAASIQLGLVQPIISFYEYVIAVYFLAGFVSGFLVPGLSWRWGVWLTIPWIFWIFFNIASSGFKDGMIGSTGWLLLYSFPIVPACIGAFTGSLIGRWKKK